MSPPEIAMPTALPPLTLDDVTRGPEDPFATLNGLLNDYNAAQGSSWKQVPLWLFARDATGKVQGGIRGASYWGWCAIDVLAVAEPYRRQGIGSRLLREAEEIARRRGCIGIRLDTVSFQAPGFYQRHGYQEFGRLEDHPPGHTRIWFMKRF
jgi:GNAT superfamily N-acetyltransferase